MMKTLDQLRADMDSSRRNLNRAMAFKPDGWTDADTAALEQARAAWNSARSSHDRARRELRFGSYR